jgi:ethanolamine transporter EutH
VQHPERRIESTAEAEAAVYEAPALRLLRAVERQRRAREWLWWGVRVVGALALLSVGAAHLQQYLYLYSTIPTIGTLFVLNFVGATLIGLGLLAPVERLLGRFGGPAVTLLALGGVGLAATAFTFLLVSERTPLFGFMEPGYDPPAIMATRVAELVTVALLGTYALARLATRVRRGRW